MKIDPVPPHSASKVTANQESHRHLSAKDETALRKVEEFLDAGHPEEAFHLLRNMAQSPELLNARSVCFLRMNKPASAVSILRPLVLDSGTLGIKDQIPDAYLINYATALAMFGNPVQAIRALQNLKSQEHPACRQLKQAINEWTATLPFIPLICWMCGVEGEQPIPLKYPPGILR